MPQLNLPHDLFAFLASPHATDQVYQGRVLLLAAHPDDETIGASALLTRLNDVVVTYLTDGAPRDPRLRSSFVSGTRESYAALRAEEACCALKAADLLPVDMHFLGGTDQESIFEIAKLLNEFVDVLRRLRPAFIVTHPYEGGHPDHDTAALIAYLATRLAAPAGVQISAILEMTSYHAVEGKCVTGEFLPTGCISGEHAVSLNLSAAEREKKIHMFDCYASQKDVLSGFSLEPERLRIAPHYDFSERPHEGRLWYECLSWPMTGALWRESAVAALEQFSHALCR